MSKTNPKKVLCLSCFETLKSDPAKFYLDESPPIHNSKDTRKILPVIKYHFIYKTDIFGFINYLTFNIILRISNL